MLTLCLYYLTLCYFVLLPMYGFMYIQLCKIARIYWIYSIHLIKSTKLAAASCYFAHSLLSSNVHNL